MKNSSTNEYVGYVYKITNKVNNKVYIGETLKEINRRFRQHCTDAFKKPCWNYYFYKAIRKHGIESFEVVELERVVGNSKKDVKEKILKLEEKYIKEYSSFGNGYNSNSGGRHPIETSAQTRELQSYKKKNDPATLERMQKARESRNIEVKVNAYDYDTGEFIESFGSVKEAGEHYGVDRSGLVKVCKKITNYLGNKENTRITWRYEGDPYEIQYIVKVYDISGNLLNKFTSFASAARFYGIKYQETITRCCEGKTKSTGRKKSDKLVWRYINDDFNKYN